MSSSLSLSHIIDETLATTTARTPEIAAEIAAEVVAKVPDAQLRAALLEMVLLEVVTARIPGASAQGPLTDGSGCPPPWWNADEAADRIRQKAVAAQVVERAREAERLR